MLPTGRSKQWLANSTTGTNAGSVLENYFEENGFVPEHYHSTEELLICLNGAGCILAAGITYDFPANSVAIIPPGTVHKIVSKGKDAMRMLAFFPTAEPDCFWVNETGEEQDWDR